MIREFLAQFKNKPIPKPETTEILEGSSLVNTEKMAHLQIGQQFGLVTRDGIKVFRLMEIRKK